MILSLGKMEKSSEESGALLEADSAIDNAQISIQNVSMVYRGRSGWINKITKRTSKDYVALSDINFDIAPNTFVTIIGPSGCGKTTLLRLVAGFEEPSAGEVLIQGKLMTYVPPYQRPVNTVFQSYALFGHMSIFDNVAFGLSVKGVSKPEIQQRVKDALKQVRLDHLSDRYPSQISGGQQQRVALARALVNRPKVILLDEPLAANFPMEMFSRRCPRIAHNCQLFFLCDTLPLCNFCAVF